jgi:hypothetical protein
MKQLRFRICVCMLSLVILTGCDQDNSVTSTGVESMPAHFSLSGTAEGLDGNGQIATCSLQLEFIWNRETERTPFFVTYEGIHGGEVIRTIEAGDNGFEFAAGVGGDVGGHLAIRSGVVDIVIPINATARGRFWQSLTHFEGVMDSNGHGTGTWTCAPLDIDQGYVDQTLIVQGTWQIDPLPPVSSNQPSIRR